MFDAITIHGLNASPGPDFGLLAEALVFYGHVNIVLNSGHLTNLLRVSGYDVIRELFDMGALSITYPENGTGVRTTNGGTQNELHDFIVFDTAKHRLQNILPQILTAAIGKSGKARRIAEQLRRHISPSIYPTSINDASLEDASTSSYVKQTIARIISWLAPEYDPPNPLIFDVIREGGFLRVNTNLDYEVLNSAPHKLPERPTFSTAYLLSALHLANGELRMAAVSNAELALSPLSSLIANSRLTSAVARRVGSEKSLELFQDFIFNDASAIREAVNHGHRNMKDVIALVQGAQKFRDWVSAKPENADLRKAYLQEVSRLGWTDSLPRKSVRWGIFTGAGIAVSALATPIAGIAASIGLSTLDYFLLDKLVQGWKPNQFVEGRLREFVRNS